MSAEEYFGDWIKVINKQELYKVMRWLSTQDKSTLCPSLNNVFKAFRLCSLDNCKAIIISQDPYPQKGVATGIAFANDGECISPSLNVIKESVINYEVPHNFITFDNTLESWEKQGILLLNSALTCTVNNVGIHLNIWKPFISSLLKGVEEYNRSIIYVLFGNQAKTFKSDIKYSTVLEELHPAYYARKGIKMPNTVFTKLNAAIYSIYGTKIEYYKEWI